MEVLALAWPFLEECFNSSNGPKNWKHSTQAQYRPKKQTQTQSCGPLLQIYLGVEWTTNGLIEGFSTPPLSQGMSWKGLKN